MTANAFIRQPDDCIRVIPDSAVLTVDYNDELGGFTVGLLVAAPMPLGSILYNLDGNTLTQLYNQLQSLLALDTAAADELRQQLRNLNPGRQ